MNPEARRLHFIVNEKQTKFSSAELELREAQRELIRYQSNCNHDFKETYDPIYTPGYTVPGDPPGTMGVDWRGPVFIPTETKERWKRYCERCGLSQETTRTEEEVRRKPKW